MAIVNGRKEEENELLTALYSLISAGNGEYIFGIAGLHHTKEEAALLFTYNDKAFALTVERF